MESNQDCYKTLLFSCTRIDVSEVDKSRMIELLNGIQDDKRLLGLVEIHGLAPLFHALLTHHELMVDANFKLALKSLVLRHQAIAKARYQAIDELSQAFQQESIVWVALKGLALAPSLYDNVADRPMRDMDILVAKRDLVKVVSILRGLRYAIPDVQPSRYMRGVHQLPNAEKVIDGFTISLEVHHNAMSQDAQDSLLLEDVEQQIKTLQWQQVSIPVLPDESMLHQLCRHLEALHPGGNLKLINVLDVVAFAEKKRLTLDWRLIAKKHPHVLNTLNCLNYIIPLSQDLCQITQLQAPRPLNGVGEIMLPLTTIFASQRTLFEKLRLLFLPSDWWLHLYYGVEPQRNLIFIKFIRHPFTLSRWLLSRLISSLMGG